MHFEKLNLACVLDFSLVSIEGSLLFRKTVAKLIEPKIVGVLSLKIRKIVNFFLFRDSANLEIVLVVSLHPCLCFHPYSQSGDLLINSFIQLPMFELPSLEKYF